MIFLIFIILLVLILIFNVYVFFATRSKLNNYVIPKSNNTHDDTNKQSNTKSNTNTPN